MELSHTGFLVLIGLAGGVFGSMMGVGGGALIVPLLTLAAGLPVKEAIACSLVAVAGTSCASAASYVRLGFTNVRLALLLGTVSATGAIIGALLVGAMDARVLAGLFGLLLLYVGYSMLRRRGNGGEMPRLNGSSPAGLAASLSGEYRDEASGRAARYRVGRVRLGMPLVAVGGLLSGLLGIGGGVVNVPAMNLAMGVPMKAAVGTSSFMIGITAVAGAFVHYEQGYVDAFAAAAVFVGVFAGAQVGVLAVRRMKAQALKAVFSGVLFAVASLMLLRAAGVAV